MEILKLILLVLSPGILYAFALVAMRFRMTYFMDRCPQCQEHGLVSINWIRATILVDGQRAPDSWSYYSCERCNAHLKLHRGAWSEVNNEEWMANQPDIGV